jgi:protein associated with RNAse G/E
LFIVEVVSFNIAITSSARLGMADKSSILSINVKPFFKFMAASTKSGIWYYINVILFFSNSQSILRNFFDENGEVKIVVA